jgi:hypothetical protein
MAERSQRTRGPSRFRERDIARAIRAAQKAKIQIAAIRIEVDGALSIIPGEPQTVSISGRNPFDD